MEVFGVLFGLAAIAAMLWFGAAMLLAIGGVLFLLWPTILGVVLCVAAWGANSNFAALLLLAGIGGQYAWGKYGPIQGSSSSPDPMTGKKRTYDSKGRVSGYVDE